MLQAFEKATGQTIAYEFAPRWAEDVANCYAKASLAKDALKWQAEKNVEAMCQDTWRWQSQNPKGY